MDTRSTTLLVDPDIGGHHMQSVSWIAGYASSWSKVVLLTSVGASADPAFREYLGEDVVAGRLEVREVFSSIRPSTAELVVEIGKHCRASNPGSPVRQVIHLDGDQALKRWWYLAPRMLRSLPVRPTVRFMLTRYPARMSLGDRTGLRLRVTKAILVVVGRVTGALTRAVGYAGRDDTSTGWIVGRVRDPEFCTAHARDRDQWRRAHGLPDNEKLVGVFGVITERRNAPMILEALEHGGIEARIVLAGAFSDQVRTWLDSLAPHRRQRIIARDQYLANDELDQLVAAVDVIPVPLTNNGPSGIMGKAEAAGVPVITAGSTVRAREVAVMGAGVACDLAVPALAVALRSVLDGEVEIRTGRSDVWSAVDAYCRALLGAGPA